MKRHQSAASTSSTHTGWRASISLLWVFFIFPAGCGKTIADAPFEVLDTGVWATNYSKPVWLDNHRILFQTTETLRPGSHNRVVVWDTDTKTTIRTNLTENFIYSRFGNITYVTKDEVSGKITYYRGPIENIKEHPAPGPDMHLDPFFDCDWVPTGKPTDQDQLPWIVKLFGENFTQTIARWSVEPYEHQKRLKDRKTETASGPKGKILYHKIKTTPARKFHSLLALATANILMHI